MSSQHGQCRNKIGSFVPGALPIQATPPNSPAPLHMSGATACSGYQFEAVKITLVRSCRVTQGTAGRAWRRVSRGPGPSRNSWPALSTQLARLPTKRRLGTERRRVPNVLHTAAWRACDPKVIENKTCLEHFDKALKLVPQQVAPNVTHNKGL